MAQISIRKKGSGDVVGSGALVALDTVLTCIHVLRDGGYARSASESVTIEIDGNRCTATLADTPWIGQGSLSFPADRDLDERLDFAILKLTSSAQRQPVLRRLASGSTEPVKSFGFTANFPKGIEGWAQAPSVNQARGVAQLDAIKGRHPIERGFSGSAVLGSNEEVLGMVVARWMPAANDPHSPPTAYMIPIESIAERVRAHSLDFPEVAPSFSAKFPQADEVVDAARKRRKPGAPTGDAAQIVSESKIRPQWIARSATGYAGRSGFLDELLIECYRQDVVPFYLDLREAAGLLRSIFYNGGSDEQLRTLFDGCRALNGYGNFEAAHRAGLRSMLVLDGIDEDAAQLDNVIRLLEWVKANRGSCSIAFEERPANAAEVKGVHRAIEEWAEYYDRKDQMETLELLRLDRKDRAARPFVFLVSGPSAEMHDALHSRLQSTLPPWLGVPALRSDYRLTLPDNGRLIPQRMCDCLQIDSWSTNLLPRGLIYFRIEISQCPKLDSRRAEALRALLNLLNDRDSVPDLGRSSALCVGISITWEKSGPAQSKLQDLFPEDAFPNLRFRVLPNLRSPRRDDAGEWADIVHNRKPGGLTPMARQLLIASAHRAFGNAMQMPMGLLLPEFMALAK